ncbi:MAG TPA: DUF1015 domain-containing protein [Candidatus Saccharimonadales bacterium]|jgi:uncharacterized protein (DUF1015 family)|nr:DUF1015 domain-containing protein [Candidatus Saccharimonadales bacterium]
MTEIVPFKALRYDPEHVRLDDVTTQPYDKITPEMQSRYYDLSPHNLVRIILGRAGETDREGFNVYSRAAEYLHDWRAAGILGQDAVPSIYYYCQTFTVPGTRDVVERRGFIALARLHDYADGVVFRHEQTLAKPRADRLNLLRHTRAHFGQIFMLYRDPEAHVEGLLATDADPDMAVLDEFEVLHRVWRVSDPAAISAVQQFMRDRQLLIADGHHRYETALAYRNECRASGNHGPHAPHEFVMTTCIPMESRGLVILPTHRIVHSLENFDREQFLESARRFFDFDRIDLRSESRSATTLLHEAGEKGTAFVAITRQGPFLLKARKRAISEALATLPPGQRELDVVQLHKVLLEKVLGISEEAVRNQQNVKYERDAFEAISQVRQGANVAFLMNPAHIEQVSEIAFSGEVLPQKSTDFYPKLLSGLAIYALD